MRRIGNILQKNISGVSLLEVAMGRGQVSPVVICTYFICALALGLANDDECLTQSGTKGICILQCGCSTLIHHKFKPTVCKDFGMIQRVCCPLVNETIDETKTTIMDTNKFIDTLYVKDCGIRPNPYRQRNSVDNGAIVEKDSWPWVAAVLKKQKNKFDYQGTGTVINERYIITMAQLVYDTGYDEIRVKLGVVNLADENDGDEYRIEKIISHEGYVSHFRGNFNDIALLRVKGNIRMKPVVPLCLPIGEERTLEFDGMDVVAVGWGRLYFGEDYIDELRGVNLLVANNSFCDVKLPYASKICAMPKEERKNVCNGFSGAPIMLKNQDTWSLIGMVSYGKPCGRVEVPSVSTRVSYFLPWIVKNIAK